MDEDRSKPGSDGRRAFLKGAGATLALAGAAAAPVPAAAQPNAASNATALASAGGAQGYQSLSLEEAATTEALVSHMWPADGLTPSGVDLGFATFIDRQLAGAFGGGDRLYLQGPFRKGKPQHGYQLAMTPEAWYRAGIAALNSWCVATHKKPFDRLDERQREETLQTVAGGKANTPSFDLGGWFNGLLYPLFAQGAFADPIYGGNRGKAVWKMIGYPGLPATYRNDVVTFRGKRHPKSDSPKSMEDFA
jgi:gluconate 2-dehydrogenase gamma chain